MGTNIVVPSNLHYTLCAVMTMDAAIFSPFTSLLHRSALLICVNDKFIFDIQYPEQLPGLSVDAPAVFQPTWSPSVCHSLTPHTLL